jgi:protoporphyrinogen oxidase
MLTVLVGAPIAALACERYKPREYAGRIVGGNKSFGHRVLDSSLEATGATSEDIEIAIVGAGVAGLSAAWRLERQGEPRYVVLELESRAGGTSCYATDGVVPYPWAAHYLPVPEANNVDLTALLTEIGAIAQGRDGQMEPAEIMLVRAPDERLYIDGRWISGLLPRSRMHSADWAEFSRFQKQVQEWVAFRDSLGRRAFALPLVHCSPDSPWIDADAISAAEWLRKENYRSKVLHWWLEYGCRDDYGCNLETTSAWALMHYHSARVSVPGAASAQFLTWPEGNGRLIRHFEAIIGTRMRHQQLVVSLRQTEQRVELKVVQPNGKPTYRIRARHVVLAVPRFVASHLLKSSPIGTLERLETFSYAPWMVANLHLRERPRSEHFPLSWDNVLYDSPSLGYVVATHQTLRDDGPTILTYYFPFTAMEPHAARSRLANLNHTECCDIVMSDLVRAHPDLPDLVSRIDVWRWGHAMIRPIPGLIWGGARSEAGKPQGRVHFANTDLSGLALFEEAHAHGIRAADAIMKERRAVPVVG